MSDETRDECSHSCGGDCCRSFYLPFSPEELKEKVEDGAITDGAQILAMVEHLGHFEKRPHQTTVKTDYDSAGHYYRCRNLGVDGLCTVYDSRPEMCRSFPYDGDCNYGAQPIAAAVTVVVRSTYPLAPKS